jgi:uncharacterized glyoxalase superfamily protein PhnB
MRNRSAPPQTIVPVLTCRDVRAAVEWLVGALGFEERVRIGDGHRAQLSYKDAGVVVTEPGNGREPPGGGVCHLVKLRVEDVDAAFARACAAGGAAVEEPTTFEYGERSAVVADPDGHRWELTQSVRDVAPEAWGGTAVAGW